MTSRTLRLAIGAVTLTLTAAAPAAMHVAAFQQVTAERAHAQQLATVWAAGHRDQASRSADEPAIVSGRIVNAAVNVQQPPDSPSLTFKFRAGASGFNNAYFQFYSATTQQSFTITCSSDTARSEGSFTIQSPGAISQYAGPGTYTLDYAGIGDNAGNFVFYSNTELASLFRSLDVTVTNGGSPDTTVPILTSGEIITPTVSLSSPKPVFLAKLSVSDTISGVSGIFITFSDPKGQPYTAYNPAPSPIIRSAALSVGLDLPSYVPTGTWTINEVFVKDVAGNTLEIGGAPDIQKIFGTNSFQVTE